MAFRTENDSLGPVQIPADKLWGPQTQRCRVNFEIGDDSDRMPMELISALAHLKMACCKANLKAERLPADVAAAIITACKEVIDRKLDDSFVLPIWQTGSGTQSNMNMNEVIAKRASMHLSGDLSTIPVKNLVHPNDQVNLGQSSNDVFPTAQNMACWHMAQTLLVPEIKLLGEAIKARADLYAHVYKIGRTHMMDATPLTVSQEMSAWYTAIEDLYNQRDSLIPACQLAIGGTAVGTGLNTFEGFDQAVVDNLEMGVKFEVARNKFAALSLKQGPMACTAYCNTLASVVGKVANDIRLLASGPRCGLGELNLPENEPGSSIMPGKINPTQVEALTMVTAMVFGNTTTNTYCANQGHLQLNVYGPIMLATTLRSMRCLATAMRSFRLHCVDGMVPNLTNIEHNVRNSLMLVTCLTPKIGYDEAAKCALQAHKENDTLKSVVVEKRKLMSSADFDQNVDPSKMVAPMAAPKK